MRPSKQINKVSNDLYTFWECETNKFTALRCCEGETTLSCIIVHIFEIMRYYSEILLSERFQPERHVHGPLNEVLLSTKAISKTVNFSCQTKQESHKNFLSLSPSIAEKSFSLYPTLNFASTNFSHWEERNFLTNK